MLNDFSGSFLSLEEEDDDDEMDMNSSSARGNSDDDDESGLSKKDVGLLARFVSKCLNNTSSTLRNFFDPLQMLSTTSCM